jgi:hypothetical protein
MKKRTLEPGLYNIEELPWEPPGICTTDLITAQPIGKGYRQCNHHHG